MAVYPIYVAPTPYNASELSGLDYAQAFDTIYLAHLYYPFSKLTRASHSDWTYSEVTFGPAIGVPTGVAAVATIANTDSANTGDSYFPQTYNYVVSAVNTDGQESDGSTADGATNDTELPRNYTTISWTAPASGTVDYYRVYKAHESGGYGFIGETKGTSFVDDGFQPDYADAPINNYNPLSGAGNYPARVAFWEQRVFLGRTANLPNAIFASRSADFENLDYARPQQESDSISITITTGEANAIEAFIPMGRLLVGTSDNVFRLRGANDDILVPNPPPAAERQIGRGLGAPKPIKIDEVAFYQPRIDGGLRTIGYSFEADGFKTSNVSIFASHLFESKRIVAAAYAADPHSIIWAARDDGALLAFTWESEQQVWGWTECDLGGFVEDVCVIPENGESRVYLLVKRTINGAEHRYVERMWSLKWTDYTAASYMDCSKFFQFDTPSNVITTLDHLEGEAVGVLADGYYLTATVVDGKIDIGAEYAASTVIVGLPPFEVLIETMPLPHEERKKVTGRVSANVIDGFDFTMGRSLSKMEAVKLSKGPGAPVPFTGVTEPVTPEQLVDPYSTVFIQQRTPYPLSVLAVHFDVA